MSKELSEQVKNVAVVLAEGVTVNAETGDVTFTKEATEKAVAALELTDALAVYQKSMPLLVAAAKVATAESAKPAMQSNPKLAVATSNIKMGTDTLNTKLYRSRENFNPGTGTKTTAHWGTSSSITTVVTKPNGQNKLAAAHIAAMYADMAADVSAEA